MATKKLHFETLQLHVGQEQPDPATDSQPIHAQCLSIKPPPTFFATRSMLPIASDCVMLAISTDD